MARITVEDCIDIIPNQFDLVILASQRARELASGLKLTLPRDNDKNPIVALREIAAKTVQVNELQENLIKSLQKHHLEDYVMTEEEASEEEMLIGDEYKMPTSESESSEIEATEEEDLDAADSEDEEEE